MENRTGHLNDNLYEGITDGVMKKLDANRGGVVSSHGSTQNIMHSLSMQYGICECSACVNARASADALGLPYAF